MYFLSIKLIDIVSLFKSLSSKKETSMENMKPSLIALCIDFILIFSDWMQFFFISIKFLGLVKCIKKFQLDYDAHLSCIFISI